MVCCIIVLYVYFHHCMNHWSRRNTNIRELILQQFHTTGRRTIGCTEYENRMDFGFAVTPYTGTSIQCQQKQHRNYHLCLKRTIDFNFVGNQFENGRICCLYNISSMNLHLRHEWYITDDDTIISERLCYSSKL